MFPGFSPEQIDFWHIAIRKLGHITEYSILALLAYRCLRHDEGDLLESRTKTIGFVLVAALLDEWHQWFTAFRGPSIVDVGYDCFGAVCALWLVNLYETWRLRSHSIL
jgi:VanZ family protein